MAALRPRGGNAVPNANGAHALHQRDRDAGRLALANPAAAPHRQRLRLFVRAQSDDEAARGTRRGGRRRADRRAPCAQVQGRAPQAQLGRELRRRRTRQRLSRAARIDQHLPDPGGDHARWSSCFPRREISPLDRDEFNRLVDLEYDRIRDFLILHYHATERDDSEFWNYVRTMQVPDTLHEKIELFRRRGRVAKYREGVFLDASWIAVYIGQRVIPEGHDMRADLPAADAVDARHGSAA